MRLGVRLRLPRVPRPLAGTTALLALLLLASALVLHLAVTPVHAVLAPALALLFAGVGVLHGLDKTLAWAPAVLLVFALALAACTAFMMLAPSAPLDAAAFALSAATAAAATLSYLAGYALALRVELRWEPVEAVTAEAGGAEEGAESSRRQPAPAGGGEPLL